MPLSDRQIKAAIEKGEIRIEPLRPDAIQPASVDVTLSPLLKVLRPGVRLDLTASAEGAYTDVDLSTGEYELAPGGFALGACVEYISFGPYCGLLVNRSSFARLGLNFALSSYANPGYEGTLPLAISNVSGRSIKLIANRRVAQVLFLEAGEVEMLYKDRAPKYQHERGPSVSKHHLDVDLQAALRSMGLTGKQFDKAQTLLDERIEKAAEQLAREHGEDRGG